MNSLKISRFKSFQGNVKLPGSKSIANRAILCAAFASGRTVLKNLPPARDIEVLLESVKELGISVTSQQDAGEVLCNIQGNDGPISKENTLLYLENAGTALRPLTAILSTGYGKFIITGNTRMQQRPIGDLVRSLKSLDVNIQCNSNEFPPIEIQASGLKGGKVRIPTHKSSQFITAMMLAAPLAQEDIEICLIGKPTSLPYIHLTIDVMKKFGISIIQKKKNLFLITAPQKFVSPDIFCIEGDATSATYFLGAAALPNCGPVRVQGLGANSSQGDLQFTSLLQKMGAQVQIEKNTIEISGAKNRNFNRLQSIGDIDMSSMPDAAMTLAVLALFADGPTHIQGIGNLRLKESERIKGLKNELEKLGAKVLENKTSLHITPPEKIHSATIESYDDHRMAMSFSLAAYGANITINNPDCVDKTYRGFFDDFLPLCS